MRAKILGKEGDGLVRDPEEARELDAESLAQLRLLQARVSQVQSVAGEFLGNAIHDVIAPVSNMTLRRSTGWVRCLRCNPYACL